MGDYESVTARDFEFIAGLTGSSAITNKAVKAAWDRFGKKSSEVTSDVTKIDNPASNTNIKHNGNSGSDGVVVAELTASQLKSINKISEINHMLKVRKNLSGDILDTGHIEKLLNAKKGLEREINSLVNSLKNPKLNEIQKNTMEKYINDARDIVERINELTK